MNIEVSQKINVKLNDTDKTATIVSSPKATGHIFIPRFVIHEKIQYVIISLSKYSFSSCKIDSLTFPEDSEVISFDDYSFQCATVNKLQIPPKLNRMGINWCYRAIEINKIEVSPKNENFSLFDNKFLVGKSQASSEIFDTLYYAQSDIVEAIIPSQINKVRIYSFYNHKKLKSIIFPSNSKVEIIESEVFNSSTISKLVLPASVSQIRNGFNINNFNNTPNLVEIEVPPENKNFKLVNKKYLFKKGESGNFDSLVFCCRDIENIIIPSYTKEICESAFEYCKKIKSLVFEQNSSLEKLCKRSFAHINGIKKMTFPSSLKCLEPSPFDMDKCLESLEFLSTTIDISSHAFQYCSNLAIVTFPNANKINIMYGDSLENCPTTTVLKVKQNVELAGKGLNDFKKRMQYIEESDMISKEEQLKTKEDELVDTKEKSPKTKEKLINSVEQETKQIISQDLTENEIKQIDKKDSIEEVKEESIEEISVLKKRIRYLESRLMMYEPLTTIDQELNTDLEKYTNSSHDNISNGNFFIDESDEKFHHVVGKIGEGSTSIALKIIDKRTDETMCKKILKINDNENDFERFRNNFKEFEVLYNINHPCICKAIGVNPQEKVAINNEGDEDDDEIDHNKEPMTTIAVFMKYEPYSLRKCLETGQLNNTLKTKITIEIAFGMSHVHSLGMIHRDLKIENVMLDYIYEAKLIDFGLVHVDDLTGTKVSLTRGVGTLAYMSPEMASEEEYNNKTDVYSFGVLLHVIFSGRLPKQSLKDKINNKEATLSRPSSSMSEYCLQIIKRCMSFEPEKRPTFDEIIDDLYKNSFKLAAEVDYETILHRYQVLNRLRALQKNSKQMNS